MTWFAVFLWGASVGALVDNFVHRKLRAEVDELLAMFRRGSGFSGYVIDAGGGQVGVMVDRDTEQYPDLGARVRVYQSGEKSTHLTVERVEAHEAGSCDRAVCPLSHDDSP